MTICPKCKGRATKLYNISTGLHLCQQCGHKWIKGETNDLTRKLIEKQPTTELLTLEPKEEKEKTMPMINITERDIKRGTIVEPAWYRVKVEDSQEKTSKSGTSQNYVMEGVILFNADNGSEQYAGVPTPNGWLFNEGAIGFAIGFLKACGANDGNKGGRFELADSIGKELDIFIENGTWEGRTVNKINHKYREVANPNLVPVPYNVQGV